MKYQHLLFDWGNTLMKDIPGMHGPMSSWPSVSAIPGAVEILGTLSQQLPCHIATNANASSEDQIRTALKRVNLDGYITEIFCYKRIGTIKPEVAFFQYITQTLGCSADNIIMIGDSLETDIMGALNANIKAIWFNPSHLPCPPDINMITQLQELPDLIQSL